MQTQMLTDPYQRATTVKKPGYYRNQCRLWKSSENKLKLLKMILETKTVTPITLTQTILTIITTTTKTVSELKASQKLFIHAVRQLAKRTTPQKDVMFEPMQQKGHFPGGANRMDIINKTHRTV